MTTTAQPRHAYVTVIDIEDTVTLHLPENAPTQRITPAPRRPKVDPARFEERVRIPRTISVVDEPWQTIELPALVEYSLRPRKPDYVGRHHKPGLVARLRRSLRGGRR